MFNPVVSPVNSSVCVELPVPPKEVAVELFDSFLEAPCCALAFAKLGAVDQEVPSYLPVAVVFDPSLPPKRKAAVCGPD